MTAREHKRSGVYLFAGDYKLGADYFTFGSQFLKNYNNRVC